MEFEATARVWGVMVLNTANRRHRNGMRLAHIPTANNANTYVCHIQRSSLKLLQPVAKSVM